MPTPKVLPNYQGPWCHAESSVCYSTLCVASLDEAAPSADRPFKSDEDTFHAARTDAALDFNGCDRLELPALGSLLVEHILELFARHFAAEHALAKLDHRVFVSNCHATTILGQVPNNHGSPALPPPRACPTIGGPCELRIASRAGGVQALKYECR